MTQTLEVTNISNIKEFDHHKLVVRFEDQAVGLRGFIAIHNDNVGPATGGTRMYPYQTEEEAFGRCPPALKSNDLQNAPLPA